MAVQPRDYLKAGNLKASLAALEDQVRDDPGKPELRIFLFQLLCVMGDWRRAGDQLGVIREQGGDGPMMAAMYQPLLLCEAFRREVFDGKRSPLIFGDPLPWISNVLESLAAGCRGEGKAALEFRDRAFEEAPAVAGEVDGTGFAWISDADGRLGPLLEAVLNGKYYWIPFERIRSVIIEAPSDLRDVVWIPAQFTWTNEGQAMGHIPARYVGTELAADDALKLGRRTEWVGMPGADDIACGLGQRMLATDQGESAILNIRKINMFKA